jgi:integrase
MTNRSHQLKSQTERAGRTPGAPDQAAPRALTDAAIRKYQPEQTRRRIRDGGAQSLFLIVEPSGVKSFEMRFRRASDGRPAKIRLGRYDSTKKEIKGTPVVGQPLTLAAARALATDILRRRALGEDIIGEHKAARHRQRTAIKEREGSTFGAAVRDYMREHAQKKTRNWREHGRLLGLHYAVDATTKDKPQERKDGLAARWGDKDVRAIDAHLIWQAVEEAKRLGIPGIAARNKGVSEARARALFVALSSLFKWLHKERRVSTNPVPGAFHPEAAKVRDRVLSRDEIRWFWQATETVDAPRVIGAPKPFKPILRLLLLTGSRLNEVAGMTRDELQADGVWELPSVRTKNKRAHKVPLTPAALELIGTMRDRGNPVFTTNGSTPVSGWNRMKRRLDATMLALAKKEKGNRHTIPPWRLHDLRRTAVTGMAELGIRGDVIELAVNHQSGARGGIAGVYNRSELMTERRDALAAWSRHIQVLASDNVVSLRRGGAA